jgi:hypothetical protein
VSIEELLTELIGVLAGLLADESDDEQVAT